MSSDSAVYANSQAQEYVAPTPRDTSLCRKLHQQLPGFASTPLKSLPSIAEALGVRAVYVKQEGTRAGLPAYKILGASWATFRSICEDNSLALDSTVEEVAEVAQRRRYSLFAATAGNHGRAVARMGKLLGIPVHIYVSNTVGEPIQSRIRSEGATVTVVEGGWAKVVDKATEDRENDPQGLQIKDYDLNPEAVMPTWHVDGYTALFEELEEQLQAEGHQLSHIVVPIGGGTLGHATVGYSKSRGRPVSVLAVEPTESPCLQRSLQAGENTETPEGRTIMGGMICPFVGPMSWPVLRQGVDVSVVVTDDQCLAAAEDLRGQSVDAGPCGSGSFAGFRHVAEKAPDAYHLTPQSVVVVVCTDGRPQDWP